MSLTKTYPPRNLELDFIKSYLNLSFTSMENLIIRFCLNTAWNSINWGESNLPVSKPDLAIAHLISLYNQPIDRTEYLKAVRNLVTQNIIESYRGSLVISKASIEKLYQ